MKLVDKNKLVHSDDHNTTAGGIKQKNLDQIVNTFHPSYDDEFYINEVVGIEEITYDDWIKDRKETNENN